MEKIKSGHLKSANIYEQVTHFELLAWVPGRCVQLLNSSQKTFSYDMNAKASLDFNDLAGSRNKGYFLIYYYELTFHGIEVA